METKGEAVGICMIGGVLLGMGSGFLLGDAGSGVSAGSALGVLLGTFWGRHLP